MNVLVYILFFFKFYTIAEKLYVILDDFANCKEKQDKLIMNMSQANLHLAADGFRQYVNTDFHIIEDMPERALVEFRIEKCKSKESPDTCMKFTTLRSTKYCEIMSSEAFGLGALLDCLTPNTKKCPWRKNVYRARNCFLDFSSFRMFPLAGVYWKIRTQVLHGTKKLGCIHAGGIILKK